MSLCAHCGNDLDGELICPFCASPASPDRVYEPESEDGIDGEMFHEKRETKRIEVRKWRRRRDR